MSGIPKIFIVDGHEAEMWPRLSPAEADAVEQALALPARKDGGDRPPSLFRRQGQRFPARLAHIVRQELGGYKVAQVLDSKRLHISDLGTAVIRARPRMAEVGLRGQYQADAVVGLLRKHGGVLHAAPGSGKTIMAAMTCLAIIEGVQHPLPGNIRILWLAQTVEQVDQAIAAFDTVSSRWGSKAAVVPSFRAECWQAIDIRKEEEYLRQVDILVGDEVHSSTDALYAIARRCTAAWWRIGMTGTPVRNDDAEMLITATWGREQAVVGRSVLVQEGALIDAAVRVLEHGRARELDAVVEAEAQKEIRRMHAQVAKQNGWRIAREGIVEREELFGNGNAALRDYVEKQEARIRYRHSVRLAIWENEAFHDRVAGVARAERRDGEAVIILVATRDMARAMHKRLAGEGAEMLFSGMRRADGSRKDIVARARLGQVPYIIATSLADQGLDIPCIRCVVAASGGRGGKQGFRLEQRTARAQRVHGEKTKAQVIDFLFLSPRMLYSQSIRRLKAYRELGYPVEVERARPQAAAAQTSIQ